MPILAEETSVYPDDLLIAERQTGDSAARDEERRWWALRTRVRQEKALARQLCSQAIPFYLPLTPQDHCIRGRRVRSFLPLFTGYLFLFGDEGERVQSLATKRVAQALPVTDQLQLWRDLRQVQRLISSGAPLTAEGRLQADRRVRIKSGPLKGVEGTVIRRQGKQRLLVQVDFLQQGASVAIDDFQVELIV